DRGEKAQAVGGRPGESLHGVLGVRHKTDDIAVLVGQACDAASGPVGVPTDVTGHDPAPGFQLVEGGLVGDVVALTTFEHQEDLLSLFVVTGPNGVGAFDPQRLFTVDEPEGGVTNQGSGKQTALCEDLEPVADTQYGKGPRTGGRNEFGHQR